MQKTRLSESDVCAKYITPALHRAGWDEATQIRREVSFTKGRIIVRGKLVSRGLPSSEKDCYKVSRRNPAPWATVGKPLDVSHWAALCTTP